MEFQCRSCCRCFYQNAIDCNAIQWRAECGHGQALPAPESAARRASKKAARIPNTRRQHAQHSRDRAALALPPRPAAAGCRRSPRAAQPGLPSPTGRHRARRRPQARCGRRHRRLVGQVQDALQRRDLDDRERGRYRRHRGQRHRCAARRARHPRGGQRWRIQCQRGRARHSGLGRGRALHPVPGRRPASAAVRRHRLRHARHLDAGRRRLRQVGGGARRLGIDAGHRRTGRHHQLHHQDRPASRRQHPADQRPGLLPDPRRLWLRRPPGAQDALLRGWLLPGG
mmetsp:Transcript_44669/g.105026  ORF Transcript_44669/g.105026 Transcript_44669/m.105026 type:complete len:284 (+) Transcript_44669:3861-4712(+)